MLMAHLSFVCMQVALILFDVSTVYYFYMRPPMLVHDKYHPKLLTSY